MTPQPNGSVFKFSCKTCGQRLSVSETKQGEKFICPKCNCPDHVPRAPSDRRRIKFLCESCGQKLSVLEGMEGEAFTCPKCAEPGEVPSAKLSAARGVTKFPCPECGHRLSVPEGLQGQKFSCPDCGVRSHVPGAPPRELEGSPESMIKFPCGQCGQKLSCKRNAAGSEIECPICGQKTLAKEVPKEEWVAGKDPSGAISDKQVSGEGVAAKREAVGSKPVAAGPKEPAETGPPARQVRPGPQPTPEFQETNGGTTDRGDRAKRDVFRAGCPPTPDPVAEPNIQSIAPTELLSERSGDGKNATARKSWWRRLLGAEPLAESKQPAKTIFLPTEDSSAAEAAGDRLPPPPAKNGVRSRGEPGPSLHRTGFQGASKGFVGPMEQGLNEEVGPDGTEHPEYGGSFAVPRAENRSAPDLEEEWEPTTTAAELFRSLVDSGFAVEGNQVDPAEGGQRSRASREQGK